MHRFDRLGDSLLDREGQGLDPPARLRAGVSPRSDVLVVGAGFAGFSVELSKWAVQRRMLPLGSTRGSFNRK